MTKVCFSGRCSTHEAPAGMVSRHFEKRSGNPVENDECPDEVSASIRMKSASAPPETAQQDGCLIFRDKVNSIVSIGRQKYFERAAIVAGFEKCARLFRGEDDPFGAVGLDDADRASL